MDDLTMEVANLATEAETLSESVQSLDRRISSAERLGMRTALAAAALVVVALLGAVVVIQQQRTTARIDTLQQQAICPLYALIIGGYDPTTRAEGPARDAYIRTFDGLRDAQGQLDCRGPLVPPRVTTAPAP